MKKTKEKFVTTIGNETLPISKCRSYNKNYYKIGDSLVENSGDCFLMEDGKYYRLETNNIVYNHTQKKYVFSSSFNLAHGYVNKEFDLGYFDYDQVENIVIHNNNRERLLGISEEIIEDNLNYRENLSDGEFYHISTLAANKMSILVRPDRDLKNRLPYNSKESLKGATQMYEKHYKTIPDKLSEIIGNGLNDYTFGFEFETVLGNVPSRTCHKLGLIPLRDGSIEGFEYATIPLQGAKGIQTLRDSLKILEDRTKYNEHCSIHVHIGNIPRTESFILAFFKLTLLIQDELFELFPLYKKYNHGYKNKNYTAPYNVVSFLTKLDSVITKDNLKRNFNILFTYLSRSVPYSDYNNSLENVKVHPNDNDEQHKWNVNTRYHLHNLIPLIFGNKKTIEFRLHTSTNDEDKLLAFLILNVSLLEFVKNNEEVILSNKYIDLNLRRIITNAKLGFNQNQKALICEYIDSRKKRVYDCFQRKNFYFEEKDVQTFQFLEYLDESNVEYKSKLKHKTSPSIDSTGKYVREQLGIITSNTIVKHDSLPGYVSGFDEFSYNNRTIKIDTSKKHQIQKLDKVLEDQEKLIADIIYYGNTIVEKGIVEQIKDSNSSQRITSDYEDLDFGVYRTPIEEKRGNNPPNPVDKTYRENFEWGVKGVKKD